MLKTARITMNSGLDERYDLLNGLSNIRNQITKMPNLTCLWQVDVTAWATMLALDFTNKERLYSAVPASEPDNRHIALLNGLKIYIISYHLIVVFLMETS
ncbi:hypothetical protein PILCRDRAFT_627395 [Piloderma croceum F 1598]|uniref:Uncharacterized protein n=1 Tax=Piloderma croceum (strain F 1598) TaxID=765440 RepID=A0A0C3EX80_PILCF|nr:hypothetical protein PILCRDRAFT_627395 [Piloderma croceum F 1598]